MIWCLINGPILQVSFKTMGKIFHCYWSCFWKSYVQITWRYTGGFHNFNFNWFTFRIIGFNDIYKFIRRQVFSLVTYTNLQPNQLGKREQEDYCTSDISALFNNLLIFLQAHDGWGLLWRASILKLHLDEFWSFNLFNVIKLNVSSFTRLLSNIRNLLHVSSTTYDKKTEQFNLVQSCK